MNASSQSKPEPKTQEEEANPISTRPLSAIFKRSDFSQGETRLKINLITCQSFA
jgi:hypothetical protein